MTLAENLLYKLSKRWPAPKRALQAGQELSGEAYHLAYAMKMQYRPCVINGVKTDIQGKNILEIGCGHGGITCFLAMNGARHVTGIDLNTYNLEIAEKFQRQLMHTVTGSSEARLNVEFLVQNATALDYPDSHFDIVWAENVFEHFMEPQAVMREAWRVLRPGGQLFVPVFSSIYSKYGAHVKQGLKVPWANLLFSEKTICNTLRRLSKENPALLDMYPGLAENAVTLRDLRRYKDLNDITFGKFKRLARECGYRLEAFDSKSPGGSARIFNRIIRRIPLLRDSLLHDIFSAGAAAVLRKPA